jgi:hypothetical protein
MAPRLFHAHTRDNPRKTQMAKKINIHFANSSLHFLSILMGEDVAIGISTATNLAIQICALLAMKHIDLTADELLFCCDVLNPCADLAQFMPPDQANIINALGFMTLTLRDNVNDPAMLQKWGIDETIMDKINELTLSDLIALAFVSRLYLLKNEAYGYKPITACENSTTWANQFIVAGVGDERT